MILIANFMSTINKLLIIRTMYTIRSLYQRLTKNLMTIAVANRIALLKKFRNSPLEMF